jgi:DNA polymerase III subunit epsilon
LKITHISHEQYQITELYYDKRYCIFDLEATGPNQEEDSITQIGALLVECVSGVIERTFNSLVQPATPIPETIERLTGIRNIDVQGARRLEDIHNEFLRFTKNPVLVTQAGYEYDWPLLSHESNRKGLPMLTNPVLDTKVLYTYLYPETTEVVSTNYLIQHYGIDDQDIRRHDALEDCRLIARIFLAIMDDYRARGIDDILINQPLTINKVKLPPL